MPKSYENARDHSILLCGQALGHSAKVSSQNLGPERSKPLLRADGVDAAARPVSVFLQALIGQQLQAVGAYAPIVARVKFGQAGASATLDVDVAQGTIITLPASFVEVTIYVMPDPLTGEAFFEFEEITVMGAVVEGPRAGGARPTLTQRVTLPAEAPGQVFQVPPYAKEFQLIQADDVGARSVQWSLVAGTTKDGAVVAAGEGDDIPFDVQAGAPPKIPGHARALVVTNPDRSEHTYTLTWFLEV